VIPKKIYYIFGLDEKFRHKPFSFYHYLNIASARLRNPDYEIEVIYKHEPENIFFKSLDAFCTKTQIQYTPESLNNQRIISAEHTCGYLRVKQLYNNGGIYLDTDVICLKRFDDLLNKSCVMGKEYGSPRSDKEEKFIGLCDAVILSEAKHLFLKAWEEDYNKNYQAHNWNYNAVVRPYELSLQFPTSVHVLPRNSFFKFSWAANGSNELFSSSSDISDCYVIHLWNSVNIKYLTRYNNPMGDIWKNNSTVTSQYKKIIEDLLDFPVGSDMFTYLENLRLNFRSSR